VIEIFIFKSLLENNMQDLPPEFSETVDKYFWELIQEDWQGGHDLYVQGDRN